MITPKDTEFPVEGSIYQGPAPTRRTELVQGKQEGDAMLSWQVGAVKITRVLEMLIPSPTIRRASSCGTRRRRR
jgi:hypothetical protein